MTPPFGALSAGSKPSQKQNFLIVNVPRSNVEAMRRELAGIGLPTDAPAWRQSLVSCTGTQFCNLAVVETKERAREILEYLEREVRIDTPIMVSVTGCPNACAQYQIPDIGLTGIPAIHQGRKQDGFNVLVGGRLGEDPKFGREIIEKVPAVLVHKVIGALVGGYMRNRLETDDGNVEAFGDFVSRVDDAKLRELASIAEWQPPAGKRMPARWRNAR